MKYSRPKHFLLTILLLISCAPTLWAGICTVEPNGTLIQAVNYTSLGNNFELKSSYLKASSDKDTNYPPSGSPVSYELNFPAAATYRIFVRGNGQDSGSKDSVWYGVDEIATGNLKFNSSNDDIWSTTEQNMGGTPADINISSPGTHRINFWTREKGFQFKAFLITTDTTRTSILKSDASPNWTTAINPTDPDNNSCGAVVDSPDSDGDNYTIAQGDCNDNNASINPGAFECTATGLGDGVDNNCNGTPDEGCYNDNDADGITSQYDCNDNNAAIYPGNREICNDGQDNDCNGMTDGNDPNCDVDKDGYTVEDGDCRDDQVTIHPGATEICGDLVDNDCANGVDDGCDTTVITDSGLISQVPLILKNPAKPQVMLNLSNDHQLYFSAYSDYDDLNQDGIGDGTYIHSVDYFGYYDSRKCYNYNTTNNHFEPVAMTSDKYCAGGSSGDWSGNFLNWASTARIDAVRKILYGGYRSTDSSTLTVLERSYLPNDAHSWVKYYAGDDIAKLTPFTVNHLPTTATSSSTVTLGTGSKTFTTNFVANEVRIGDQISVAMTTDPSNYYMHGVVQAISGSDVTLNVVEPPIGSGSSFSSWTLTNYTRRGITLCNTTVAASGYSQNITTAPLIRVAYGDYSLWTANERWQCRWDGEKSTINGNNIGLTGMTANERTPIKTDVGLGIDDYVARVEVCKPGTGGALLGNEKCREYPDGNFKPVGLLQTHGESDSLMFGMMTGSYQKNKSGGVLRKNIDSIKDEINVETDGTFKTAPSTGAIIDSLNRLRLYGYNHSTGVFGDGGSGDNCTFQLTSFNDGNCSNWGNPQSEIFLESLRYFAGKSANSDFTFTGDDKISGLGTASWTDPLSSDNYCSSLNVINFNASMASYDDDQLAGVFDLNTSRSASDLTDIVGAGESIHGNAWLVGENGSDNNQLCTEKSISSLGAVKGICPEAPRLSGSYYISGLAHYAYTSDIRSDLQDDQTVKTFGVSLAPAIPKIEISVPGHTDKKVTILPACRNTKNTTATNCSIVNFKPVKVDKNRGEGTFFIQWEDSEQGGDYDQDMSGFLRYQIDLTGSAPIIEVTTDVIQESTTGVMGFGYIISGTGNDGFHVHSGIEGFNYTDNSSVDGCSNCQVNDEPTLGTYVITGSPSGQLESPLYYAAKWGGYDKDNSSLTFPTDAASWDADGDDQPDNYFFATNPSQLEYSLGQVFTQLAEISSSSAAVASNSTQLQTGTTIYQAKFNSSDWSGELLAIGLTRNTSGQVITSQVWNAESQLPTASNRKIYTLNPSAIAAPYGLEFKWSTPLSAAQQSALNTNIAGTNDGLGEERVNFFRGDRTTERQNGGHLRDRNLVMGDIVNSDPVFVGTPDFAYDKLVGTEGTSYTSFRASTNYASRSSMVYVGANDGMLHAFNAATGVEEFSYLPNSLIAALPRLAATNYGTPQNGHRYMVDGAPKSGDAYFASAWHTVLLGTTGAGGKSVFALDVTNPANFDASSVLWEITPQTQNSSGNLVYADLGYTLPQPTLGRLASGEWVVFISNGYHSATGKAVLYVVDIATGLPLATTYGTIDVGVGDTTNPNGLSTPVPVDIDGDRIIDYVYAGDLKGNLWKFDFKDSNTSKWGVAYKTGSTPAPLFTARGPNNEIQPITVRPAVGRHPNGTDIMVWFGTGKFFDANDNVVPLTESSRTVETFYGVQDKGSPIAVTDRSVLQSQSILYEGPVSDKFSGRDIRVVSTNTVNYGTGSGSQVGWYLDLLSPNSPSRQTERVVEMPILNNGKIIFVTLIPSDSPCEPGGTSWLMEMEPFSGGRLDTTIYDADGDGDIDSADTATVNINGTDVEVAVTGIESEEGIIQAPKILDDDADANSDGTSTQVKVFSGSTGNLMFQEEKGGDLSTRGRQSWRQLR